jgi:hypothetical protein
MKNLIIAVSLLFILSACERVAPNYVGVLMENYGKSKSDYSIVQGRVSTLSPGTELFQVPLWEQRAGFKDNGEAGQILHLKAADNTEFTATPQYSYTVIRDRAVDLVFQNARLGSGDEFMRALENNVLEAAIYDVIKDESRKFVTDTLMAAGGSLRFEDKVKEIVHKLFENKGLKLETFTAQLEFTEKVREKIDNRNEVNTNISVLDQKIAEQRKTNELEELKTQQQLIRSRGLTNEVLQMEFIEAWKHTKQPLYGELPTFFKQVK